MADTILGFQTQADDVPQKKRHFLNFAYLKAQQQQQQEQEQEQQRQQAAPAASVPGGGPGGSAAGAAAPATTSHGVALEVTQSEVQAYQACYAQQQQQQLPPEGEVPLPIIQASTAPTPVQRPRVLSDHDMVPAAPVAWPQAAPAHPQGLSAIELPRPSIMLPPGPGQMPLVQQGSRLFATQTARTGAAAQAAQQHAPAQQQSPVQHPVVTSPVCGARLTQRPSITTPATAQVDPGPAPQRDAVGTGQQQTSQPQPAVQPASMHPRPAPELLAPTPQPTQTAPAGLRRITAGPGGLAHQRTSPVKGTQPPTQTISSPQRRQRIVSTEAAEHEWADVVARKAVPVGSPRY